MGEKLNWPPGYRFKPTDEELICYYLKRRILRQKLYCDIIKDRELYGPKCTPWDLFDVHDNSWIVFKDKPTEKIVYVFTTLSKLRKTDDVRSRENTCKKAGCGTWVGQNKKPIKDGMGNLIGEKRMLVFEITEIGVEFDRSKAGYFKMHEYSLSGVNKGFGSTAGDDFVLCKITFDSAKKLTYKLGLKSDVEICGEGQKKEQIMKNLEHTVCDNLEETGNLPSQSEGSVCGNFEGSECLTSENLVVLDSGISNYDYLLDNCYVAATQECNIAAPECNELCGDPGFDMDLLIDLLTNDQEEGPKDSNALGKRKFEEEENLSREQSNLSRHGVNGLCKWPFPYVTVLLWYFRLNLIYVVLSCSTLTIPSQFLLDLPNKLKPGEIITSTVNGTDTQQSLLRQGSLTFPSPLSQKTVDEVCDELHKLQQEQENGSAANVQEVDSAQHQTTSEEITLEDFLIMAGVVRAHDRPPSPLLQQSCVLYQNNNNTALGSGPPGSMFPGLPHTALDIQKIQYNKDVGQSILESYSRVIETLDFNLMTRIDDLQYVDDATRQRAAAEFSPMLGESDSASSIPTQNYRSISRRACSQFSTLLAHLDQQRKLTEIHDTRRIFLFGDNKPEENRLIIK
ncbi:hypothetical protein POM88_023370 [Heracleum sosnowskyi]|uniref:NAC domain-containing protein n=1 Tax=Heracleum sosnowskyi TaxID=360622 RepID=A0AAD8MQE5_9APIA|nr:hypothetical protein POM88_023370 [Heracleum sosnowskyi]